MVTKDIIVITSGEGKSRLGLGCLISRESRFYLERFQRENNFIITHVMKF